MSPKIVFVRILEGGAKAQIWGVSRGACLEANDLYLSVAMYCKFHLNRTTLAWLLCSKIMIRWSTRS